MTRDRGTGLIALVLGIAVAIGTAMLPTSNMAGDVGPRVFPAIAAFTLIVCGLGLLITGGQKVAKFQFGKQELVRLAKIGGVVLLYVILMNYIGFIIPTIAVLFAMSTMFSEGKKVPWWHRAIFAVVVTLVLYFSFRGLLNLKLPTNTLF